MFWQCQRRGDTSCFSLSCAVLWANPFCSQRSSLRGRAAVPCSTVTPPAWGRAAALERRMEPQGGIHVLEQARIKAAESTNLPGRQENFIHMLIVLGNTRTSPWAFFHWVSQGAADLPKQTLGFVLRLLKTSGKSLVNFKPLLALT